MTEKMLLMRKVYLSTFLTYIHQKYKILLLCFFYANKDRYLNLDSAIKFQD